MANKQDELMFFLNVAKEASKLSYARRLKVGAVIAKNGRIITTGRNGTPSGTDNNCELEIDGELLTKADVIHAELNAILDAAAEGKAIRGAILVITHSPCLSCAASILQTGIKEVYYGEEFRDTQGMEMLRESIVCRRI